MKNKALHKTAPDTHILTIVGLMVLALILMAILQPGNYFTLKNAKSMIFQFPEYGILAFGMMVCMIAGGIDLSLVGIMNFTGVLAAMIVTKMTEGGEGMAIPAILVAIVTALVVGGACGAFNGFIIGYFNIPAMLVTLCGLQLMELPEVRQSTVCVMLSKILQTAQLPEFRMYCLSTSL